MRESNALAELIKVLDRNRVVDSSISHEVIDGVRTEWRTVNIGPKQAEFMLLRNTHNRPLNPQNVANITHSMKREKFKFDGTQISFDWYGRLINGQNRLNAIIKSGKTLPFRVGTGFPPEVFETMDIGVVRNIADVLAIAGYSNYKLHGEAARFIFRFGRGAIGNPSNVNSTVKLAHEDVLPFVESKPKLKDSVDFFMKMKKAQTTSMIKSSIVTGLHFVFAEKDATKADEFFKKLLTGVELEADSPIFHVRNRLLVNANADKHKMSTGEIVKLVVQGWNKYRKGEKVKSLRIPEMLPVVM